MKCKKYWNQNPNIGVCMPCSLSDYLFDFRADKSEVDFQLIEQESWKTQIFLYKAFICAIT